MAKLRFLLYAVLVALVMASQTSLVRIEGVGTLASPRDLMVELHATEDAPGAWPMGDLVPYRYRWLFRSLVLEGERLSPSFKTETGFYALYVVACGLSLLGATLALDLLLRRLGFDVRRATLGVVLFLAGFPVVFAFDPPIHVREDFLEFALFALALVAVVADQPLLVVVGTLFASNCREMGLLAAAPYVLTSRRPRWVRALVLVVAIAGTFAITSFRDGALVLPWFLDRKLWRPDGYQTTLRAPGEGALYVFVCFGALWVSAFLGAASRRARIGDEAYRKDLLGFPTAFLGVAAALLSSIALGQVREVRTVYLAFPWVMGLTLEYVQSGDARRDLSRPAARVAGGLVLCLGLVLLAEVASSRDFVRGLRRWIGHSFQPGFEAPELVELEGERYQKFNYVASPWNGVWLVGHASLAAALVAGARARRRREG